jgi:predicted regulator of Ras-like GTPase activity (Roadblock/LC7/MglB family)
VELSPEVVPMPQAVEPSDFPGEKGSEVIEPPLLQQEQPVSHGQEEPERATPEEPAAIPPQAPNARRVAAAPEQPAEPEIPAPIDAPAPAAEEEVAETETFLRPDETPQPMAVLQAEHFSESEPSQEIVEQEPLQALFLVEETLTVNRVIKLCCELPGINSCVLAHGSMVVASHNAPEGVDLISMSAHAADMLEAMRSSSARMGVGAVPAVTLHTEKGVISFFHRDDLTMLVFHKDRGFVPGVREKMAAVIGELTKARLTLTLGGEETAE